MKTYDSPSRRVPPPLAEGDRRRKPRGFVEWKTLRRWRRLPPWEEEPPGYLMRLAREEAGLTQAEMAVRLGCSQQAVAQAERWRSNPSVAALRAWARALGGELRIELPRPAPRR